MVHTEKYLRIKHEVLSILRKKMDEKNYKKTIKVCKKGAKKATGKWAVGKSAEPLRITVRQIKKGTF